MASELGKNPLVINRFQTGLFTRRSQLYNPFRAIGINVVQYHDALLQGINMEVSDTFTLQRRPGFSKYCSQAFATGEVPKQFYSFRDLNGVVYPLVDTNQFLYKFSTSSLNIIFNKTTTDQGFIQSVGNTLYYANGTDLYKWDTVHSADRWGLAAPVNSPSVVPVNTVVRFWGPNFIYPSNFVIFDPNGNIQLQITNLKSGAFQPVWGTVSVANGGFTADGASSWNNLGPITGNWAATTLYKPLTVVIDTNGNLQFTTLGGTSGSSPTFATVVGNTTTDGGVTWVCYGTATLAVYFGYSYVYGYRSIYGHLSTSSPMSPSTGAVFGAGGYSALVSGDSYLSDGQCNYNAAITSVEVASNVLTIAAATRFLPGMFVSFSLLATATFLNGQTVQIQTVTPTGFTAAFVHANYGPTADTGRVDLNGIEAYRTDDGGDTFYFCKSLVNTGATWSFTDTLADSQLNNFLIAPLFHLNDPPPGRQGSLIQTGLTILAYWQGRLWGASGNKVFFDAGPDCTNGIPEEAWPPANVFVFPGPVTALTKTSDGLLVWTSDTLHVILGGPQTLTFYPKQLLDNFGVSSPNCISADGDQLYLLTSQGQYFSMNTGGRTEDGQRIGDVLASTYPPSSSFVTMHRNGEDTGVFLSDGVNNIQRYSLNLGCWSPVYEPEVNAGPLKSIELSAGQYGLMLGTINPADFIYIRDLNTFKDGDTKYPANVIIGSISLSEPGQPLVTLQDIVGYFAAQGTLPTVSILFNEIARTNGAAFITLPPAKVKEEPPIGAAPSKSLFQKSWPVNSNTQMVSQLVHHIQLLIDFGEQDVKNEILSLALKPQ